MFGYSSNYAKIWGGTKFQLQEYPRSGSKAMSVEREKEKEEEREKERKSLLTKCPATPANGTGPADSYKQVP